MSHARLRDQLGAYLEGDLDRAGRALLEEHLRGCRDCREELDGLRGAVALLRGLPDPTPPSDLNARVMERIRSDGGGPVRGAFRGAAPARAAAVLAAAWTAALLLVPWSDAPSGPSGAELAAQARTAAADAPGVRPVRPGPVGVLLPGVPRPLPVRSGGVAPVGGFAEPAAPGGGAGARDFDRQLELLLGDPGAFLAHMGPHARDRQLAHLAQHAARQGRAASLASRLIPLPHPAADQLVPRLLAASFDAESPGR